MCGQMFSALSDECYLGLRQEVHRDGGKKRSLLPDEKGSQNHCVTHPRVVNFLIKYYFSLFLLDVGIIGAFESNAYFLVSYLEATVSHIFSTHT